MGLTLTSMMMDTPPRKRRPRKAAAGYRIGQRQKRALGSRGRARPPPSDSLQLAWDEENARYSPRRVFAHWRQSRLLAIWQRTGSIAGPKDPYLLRLLNLPAILLRDYATWYQAQTDNEFLLIVPWEDLSVWLRHNGFTGRVSAGGDWSP